MRIYLAGPDVFRPDAKAQGERLKALCAAAGHVGVFPLDQDLPALDGAALAAAICANNLAFIRGCDAVLANLTPFRGPAADAGTVFEVGYAAALGKPVFAYSEDPRPYERRQPADGWEVERFGLRENLMVACTLAAPMADSFAAALAQLGRG